MRVDDLRLSDVTGLALPPDEYGDRKSAGWPRDRAHGAGMFDADYPLESA